MKAQPPTQWKQPRPLGTPAHELEKLTPSHLPDICRPLLDDIAVRLQCPLEYAAAPFIVAFSALVGRRVALRLYEHDDWLIVPNLWGAVIGLPATMKAAAFARAIAPLADLENESLDKFHRELRSYKRKRSMTHSRDHSYEKPFCRRFTVTDASVEALAELLHDNPTGLLLYRDNLASWLRSMKGNKQHRAREFFLQAASGDGELICDRLGDDVLHVPTLCLSVFGGIDPEVLQSLLVQSASHSDAAALFQRIQVLFWPDVPGEWHFVDPPQPDQFDQSLRELFRQFADGQAVPADLPQHEKSQLPFVRLTPPASEVYRVWREHLESSLRARGVSSTARAHRARYRSLVPSLALLLRILDRGVGDVDQADFELALRWEQVLLAHAQRVYNSVAQDTAPQILLARLLAHRLHWESFAWEDLRRCQWSGLQKPGDLTRALITLIDTGHIRVAHATPSGRPLRYQLNPLAQASPLV